MVSPEFNPATATVGRRCSDPVPGLLVLPKRRRDAVDWFDESACTARGLGRISATVCLLSLLDRMAEDGNFSPIDRDLVFI